MSARDVIRQFRRSQQPGKAPRQGDPPGGANGYTFTGKQLEAMGGDFYNPDTPTAPAGGGLNGQGGQAGQTAAAPGQNGQNGLNGQSGLNGQTAAGPAGQNVQSNQSGLNSRTDASNPDNYTFTQEQLDRKFAGDDPTGVVWPERPVLTRGSGLWVPNDAAERAREQVANAGPIKVQDEYGNEVEAGKAPRVSDGDVIDRFLSERFGYKRRTPEEIAKEEKRRKSAAIIAALGDGLNAIAKMHYIRRGSPYVAGGDSMSESMRKRWDELDKKYREHDTQYLNAYLQMMRQRAERERQRQLDEYRNAQLDASRERQARLEAESQWRMKNGDAKTEQQRKHQENQDAVAKQKAEAATVNAQANQTRANKVGTGKSGGKSSRGSGGRSGGKSGSSRGLRPGMERVQRKTDASGRTTTTVTFEQPHVDNSIKTPQQQKKSAVGGLKFK